MITEPYERHGPGGDPTALPAAGGLALLALGGWLLTTTRPWAKPGHPVTLGLDWTASGLLLLWGLVLLTRCVRTVHAAPHDALPAEAAPVPAPPGDHPPRPADAAN
ncbi:hypothetical protein [Streptomyces sp. NPDC058279]|uniref:hypothetical protein n=1 Tax=Streptomyces sp. NPDC058279 TaxID=3346418 RepID=UPI0036E0DF8E